MSAEPLIQIQEWYAANCDGDWEHDERIRISTIDNPGWYVQINARDTPVTGRQFQDMNVERDEKDWYRCWVRAGVFEGAGGAQNLTEILKVFIAWATTGVSQFAR